MARSHGKILATVWRDPDWVKLSAHSQRLYLLLLSQPKLTLCGTLDLAVTKWARFADDTTPDTIECSLKELVLSDFVVVDLVTEEVAIRTFVRHDLNAGRMNKNLAIGFWRAWDGIESETLRDLIVSQIPADLWDDMEEHAPFEALDIREVER